MKRVKILAMAALAIGLLGGCSKFSPDETAVSIGKDGDITAAVIDVLNESYYSSEELTKNVEDSVAEYTSSAGADSIKIDKFKIEDSKVELFMKYASHQDYAAFNNIDFYVGDITKGYNEAGYRFETTFKEVEKGEVIKEAIEREEIFAGVNHPMVVFHEEMEVKVPGKILYISSNLELTGKNSAKLVSDEEAAAESETQTEAKASEASGDVTELEPVIEGAEAEAKTNTNTEGKGLAYIIYE